MKTAVLFTGKIDSRAFDTLMHQTKDIEYKFASIWEDENPSYIQTLSENKFTLIINKVAWQELFTPQFIPIVNGLRRIKEEDFEFVLKTRFDITSWDYARYIDLLQKISDTKITVLCGTATYKIYIIDIIVYGSVHKMCRLYTLQSRCDTRFPEQFLIEQYSTIHIQTQSELSEDLSKKICSVYDICRWYIMQDDAVNVEEYSSKPLVKDSQEISECVMKTICGIKRAFAFSLEACIKNNIEFIWYRPANWKLLHRTNPDMRVITEYCREATMWV